MSKISTISSYINKCELYVKSGNLNEIEDFIDEVICVYKKEIPGFTERLNTTSVMRMYEKINIGQAKSDLKNIKAMLNNYKDNIKCGILDSKRGKNEININNVANAEAVTNVNITLEQVINNINELSDDILSKEEKEDLEDKLRVLESVVNSGDKEKIKSKLVKIFNFALEKGPAVVGLVSSAVSLLNEKILPLFS